jgi:hydrogenase-4 component E
MDRLVFDVAHLFAGGLVLASFMLLYQDRMFGLLNTFALHALVVSLSVAWQAYIQSAPHLYITAVIALLVKAIIIPVALHRIIVRLGIHRTIETVVGIGQTMLAGIGLVALSILVMLPITAEAGTLAREDLAFSLLDPGGDGRQGHAAGGRDQRGVLHPGRPDRDRDLPVPHPRALRHRRCARVGALPR